MVAQCVWSLEHYSTRTVAGVVRGVGAWVRRSDVLVVVGREEVGEVERLGAGVVPLEAVDVDHLVAHAA